jgi:hypothetical protein
VAEKTYLTARINKLKKIKHDAGLFKNFISYDYGCDLRR